MTRMMLGCALLLAAGVASRATAGDGPNAAGGQSPSAGPLRLTSGGPICFGPDGLLFAGDPKAAAILAVPTGDAAAKAAKPINVAGLDAKLAALLGVPAADVRINDLAVNPISHRAYLSVSRGKGPDAAATLFTVDGDNPVPVAFDKAPAAQVALGKPAEGKRRAEAITGLRFLGGKLYVAGLANEEFASTLRTISYPFDGTQASAGIRIFHGAHGKFETAAPIRTFAAIKVAGNDELLAAYTCTPLVRIPVADLKDGAKVSGRTVAELGNRNRPLDIVVYHKDGREFALMANSARGVMKVALDNIAQVEQIVGRVNGTAGLTYETLKGLTGVEQLDSLGDAHALLLVRDKDGVSLRTIDLP